ncbi:MAG TPA: alpha-glucan family phosphorylase [Bradyrhizobium sp.]|uniref:alpha-glucan family phosphorylase n=1 Tax=Bradyrhizobium sp. TaxID=376 RepID=UPI002C5C5848|nr:alpha-glucan family phosphorylase [Bradyrhizobium sp.]HLZ01082.1 alpha-glucan family phosphorylase [Bradyrhizobium sp.]
MSSIEPFVRRTHIAYFSMEIALRPEMHTYAGGLGVLAGDTARSAADLELPIVFVSLVSRAGYVRQEIDAQGRQLTGPNPWTPEQFTEPLEAMVAVSIEGREVWIRPWLFCLTCPVGYRIPVLLLDTDLDQNSPDNRRITDHLYGGDEAYRLKQEIVLGIGGARILQALGFNIETYHLNEGHAALLTLHLLRRVREPAEDVASGESPYDYARVREYCIFTTHTPIEAAFDKFPYPLVERLLGDYIEITEIKRFAGQDHLNMTQLALHLSGRINGVSERHAETTSHLFPGYRVRAITNGVHAPTWTHRSFANLYQSHFPHWAHEPEILTRADQLSDESVWDAHEEAKSDLLAQIKNRSATSLRLDVPLIAFARRMTQYKRPDLLFSDLDRITAIARQRAFQVVFAGIAHPNDELGRSLIETINHHIRQIANAIPVVFLPNYDIRLAASLVSGADVWLNTPQPPLEASGTSGMKAALNGVLNLSVLDGWWLEAHIEGVTGWAIGNDGGTTDKPAGGTDDLYRKLEQVVLPLYYEDRPRWIWMMKQSISKIGSYFNSARMMRRYATEAYIR